MQYNYTFNELIKLKEYYLIYSFSLTFDQLKNFVLNMHICLMKIHEDMLVLNNKNTFLNAEFK
jgi:hypothetical protein